MVNYSDEDVAECASSGSFSDIGILSQLCKKCIEIGWKHPTVIQQNVIPVALENKDIIGIAETGSGKTGAFILPIVQHWILANRPLGFGLILAPTRELAHQLAARAVELGALNKIDSSPDLQVLCLVGGEDMVDQALRLAWRKHHLLVATPGRLVDHMKQSPQFGFQQLAQIRHLVLDEADRMLNMAFAEDLDKILGMFEDPKIQFKKKKKKHNKPKKLLERMNTDQTTTVSDASTKNKFPHPQTYLFSATMTKDVAKLKRAALAPDAALITSNADSVQSDNGTKTDTDKQQKQQKQTKPTKIKTGFPPGLVHYYMPLRLSDRTTLLDWVVECFMQDGLKKLKVKQNPMPDSERRIMIFCKRCHETRFVAMFLCERGHTAVGLTGKMKQSDRREALEQFCSGEARILVATDLASRGLDIPHVELVINYSVPLSEKTYRHRVGRTARAGRFGVALTLVTRDMAPSFLELETLLSPHLPKSRSPTDAVGMPRWPMAIPNLSGEHGLMIRRRLVDEAWARAGKIIRAQDAELKRLNAEDHASSVDDNDQSDLDQDDKSTTDSSEHSDLDPCQSNDPDLISETGNPNRLATTGLAGIQAARKTWSVQRKARKLKRQQRQTVTENRRAWAALGWGIQDSEPPTFDDQQESVLARQLSDSEDSAAEREHLRFDETLKTKYAKIQATKRKTQDKKRQQGSKKKQKRMMY